VSPRETNECGTMPIPVLRLLERIAEAVAANDIPSHFPNTPSETARCCQIYVWSGKECSSITKTNAVAKANQLRKMLSLAQEQRIARHLHRLNNYYITLADALSNDPAPEPPRALLKEIPRPFKSCPLVRQCMGTPSVSFSTMLTIDRCEDVPEAEEEEATAPSRTPRHRLTKSLMTLTTNLGDVEEEKDGPRPLNRSASAGSTPGHSKRTAPSLSLDLRAIDPAEFMSDLPIAILEDSESDDEPTGVLPTPKGPPKRRTTTLGIPATPRAMPIPDRSRHTLPGF